MAKRPTTQAGNDVRPSWQPVGAIIVVALAACLAGIGNELAQDDIYLIQENAIVHSVANIVAMFRSPYWPPPFNPDLYRPLTSLLLAVEYLIGAGQPMIFRLVSYGLYAAVGVNVYLLARLFIPWRIALAVALLFVAHPVHVEAVALGVGQSELVVGLIAIVMVRRYLARRAEGLLTIRDWVIIAALLLTACLFKEQGFLLPGLLIAAELILLDGDAAARWKNLALGCVALAGIALIVLFARRAVLGDFGGTFVAEALVGVSFGGRLLTMLRVSVAWLRLLVWPAHLQIDYSPREIVASTTLGPVEIWGACLLVLIATSAWLLRRKAPAYSFAVVWCAIALFPVSNLVVPTAIVLAERTLFLPSIGFVVGIGALAALVVSRFSTTNLPRALAAACMLLVVAGVARSVERQRVWRNDALLAVRSVQDAPKSFRAQRIYGDVAFDLQQRAVAEQAYARALELAPPAQRWRVHNDIARTFRRVGDTAAEAANLRASLADRPDQDDTRGFLIAADLALGLYDAAAQQADSALARGGSPAVFNALRQLADSAARVGAPAGSVRIAINTGAVRRGS
jgi:hypothetical protein